jgi:hypothetical protein
MVGMVIQVGVKGRQIDSATIPLVVMTPVLYELPALYELVFLPVMTFKSFGLNWALRVVLFRYNCNWWPSNS